MSRLAYLSQLAQRAQSGSSPAARARAERSVQSMLAFEQQRQLACLARRIKRALSDDLRRAPWRGSSNPLAGHCYVASEAAWHALGGRASGWVPCTMRHEGAPHWFLRHRDGRVLDITAQQFAAAPDHSRGRGCGFLTSAPSKRAAIVLSRI